MPYCFKIYTNKIYLGKNNMGILVKRRENMKVKSLKIKDNVDICCIQDSKFNCSYYVLSLIFPLDAETVSANALFPYILLRGSKKYSSYQKLPIIFL